MASQHSHEGCVLLSPRGERSLASHTALFPLYNVLVNINYTKVLGPQGDWDLTPFVKGPVTHPKYNIYSFSEHLLAAALEKFNKTLKSLGVRIQIKSMELRGTCCGFYIFSGLGFNSGWRITAVLVGTSAGHATGFSQVVAVSIETSLQGPHFHGL